MSLLRTRRVHIRLVGGALAAVLISATVAARPTSAAPVPAPPAAADAPAAAPAQRGVDLAPVPRLHWRDCENGFECTTARVPLDYDRPRGRTIRLALLRLPASKPSRRIGSLFVNPGGPGAAALGFVRNLGKSLYSPAVRARFDIIGMDPRGIGQSTPVRCFDTTEQSVQAGIVLRSAPSDRRQFRQRVAAARDFARRCAQRNGDLLRHVSTANVARDLDLLRRAVGDRRLTYDGISYGTYLGATYAAMFPGNVRALVLDGNFDPPAYRAGGRTPFLRQYGAEGGWATLRQFFRLCAAAGPARCAFATGGDPERKFAELVARVRRQPITLPDGDVVEYGSLVFTTLVGLYVANEWAARAQFLQDLYTAPPAEAAQRLRSSSSPAEAGATYDNTQDGQLANVCSETSNPREPHRYPRIAQRADRNAPYAGTWLTWWTFGCTFWTARDADRFTGSFRTRTAYPALVLSNRYDPITPPRNARTVARLIVGSRVVIAAGYGHTTLYNSGPCITSYRERYLIKRILPPPGAACEAGVIPFA